MAKKKRPKTPSSRKKTRIKDLPPKKDPRGGGVSRIIAARGNTIGGSGSR